MQTQLKETRAEKLVRAFLGFEIMVLLLISVVEWIVYRSYMSQSCIGRPFKLNWKDAVFCADRDQVLLWHRLNYLLVAIFLGLVITTVFASVWKFIVDRRS